MQGPGMDLRMAGHQVALCQVDFAFSVTTLENVTLRAQGHITYRDAAGTVHEVDPEGDPRALGPLLEVARSTITAASTEDDGTLVVALGSSALLRVAPHDRYEAWTLTSRTGFMVVCVPGGELAIWDEPPA